MGAVDAYLQDTGEPERSDLERVRNIIRQLAPEAEEVISYGMPAFKYNKKYLVGFFAYKDHMSLFPTPGPIEALKDKLGGFKLSKGTIQFTHDNPIPEPILKEIIKQRLAEIARL